LVLTFKFADWGRAEKLPELVSRVRGWGYRDVRTRQLVTGGQEVCLVALRRKALRRLGRKRNQDVALSRPSTKRSEPDGKRQERRDKPHKTLPGPHI
jgi:hypothetical protein